MIVSGVEDGGQVGRYYWCTITAPGADRLPWDPEECTHGPDVECAGKHGCRVEAFPGMVWNATAPKRWSWFVTYLRRRLGHCEFVGVWEDQERGVLHRHFLVRLDRPSTEKRVRAAVRNSARRWGFGSQYDARGISEGAAREAWYIASYSTKTVDRMAGRRSLDVRTGELRPQPGFRAWSCSRRWGDTMKSVRERQRQWAVAASSVAQPDAGGAAGRSPALDPNSDISTDAEAGMVDLLRAELGAVLL